jgi:hypothetical protein
LQATDPHITNVAVMIGGTGAIHINRRLRNCIGCDCGFDSGQPAMRNVLARTPRGDPCRIGAAHSHNGNSELVRFWQAANDEMGQFGTLEWHAGRLLVLARSNGSTDRSVG